MKPSCSCLICVTTKWSTNICIYHTYLKEGGWWSQPKIDPAWSSAPHTHTLFCVQLCLVLVWAEMTTETSVGVARERDSDSDSEQYVHSVLTSRCDTNICSLR